jgi:predicted O-methyltransferase YrrM
VKSLSGFVKAHWRRVASSLLERRLAKTPPQVSLDRANWPESLRDPTGFYLECVRYFHQQLPAELKQHRAYFHNPPENPRGFGEDAFHVLWFLLFQEFKPANFLEIGVFRGQTTSLAALLARRGGWICEVVGVSPFTPAGDSVSTYQQGIDYHTDTLANFEHFKLPAPKLLRAYSTDSDAVRLINSRSWDMIYIDGNHDYEIAKKDWESCSQAIKHGGVIVLDDSGLTTNYRPSVFATGGHPGPSQVAQEIDRSKFEEILQVGHNRAFQKTVS